MCTRMDSICICLCIHVHACMWLACLIGVVFTRSQVKSMGDCRWLTAPPEEEASAAVVAEAVEGAEGPGAVAEEGASGGEEAAMLAAMASYLVMVCSKRSRSSTVCPNGVAFTASERNSCDCDIWKGCVCEKKVHAHEHNTHTHRHTSSHAPGSAPPSPSPTRRCTPPRTAAAAGGTPVI